MLYMTNGKYNHHGDHSYDQVSTRHIQADSRSPQIEHRSGNAHSSRYISMPCVRILSLLSPGILLWYSTLEMHCVSVFGNESSLNIAI